MITFDIVYQKNLEKDAIKLSGDSEFQQLKIMLSGKYRILDTSQLFIYYNNNLITSHDYQKLKDIFKKKRVKLEISNKLIKKQIKEIYKYYCECKLGATYICEKCEKYLCKFCIKNGKHLTHSKNVILISEYSNYIRKVLKNLAVDLDKKILNDEAYRFFKYWEYDKEKEISNTNNLFDFLKKQLEDMKQIEIDFIISMGEKNTYNILKNEIKETLDEYALIDTDCENIEDIILQKNILIESSKNILNKYKELKNHLLNYTKAIKDIQTINQIIQKLIQEHFSYIKKQFLNNPNSYNKQIDYPSNNHLLTSSCQSTKSNHFYSASSDMKDKANIASPISVHLKNNEKISSPKKIQNYNTRGQNFNTLSNERKINYKQNSSKYFSPRIMENNSYLLSCGNNSFKNNSKKGRYNTMNYSQVTPRTPHMNNTIIEHLLFKIKDTVKIFIFSFETQSFRENIFIDKCDFKNEFTSISDIIQLNTNNQLYLISGKKHDKFYFYDYQSNTINFISNTLFSHYYGSLVNCPKNQKIYLLGGNDELNCEVYSLTNDESTNTLNQTQKEIKWEKIASLNEERQEFASMYYDNYIYVFFGFSHIKGCNLSSIERMNVNECNKFEIIYVNEQIKLCSLSCAKYYNEFDQGGILLLGGFDGEKYIDTSLVFLPDRMKIRECELVIPNMNKHFQFLFQQESCFISLDDNSQIIFDMKNNIHLLTRDSYALFSKV